MSTERQIEDASAVAGRPALRLDHATKSFGAVAALVDASVSLYPGEAHALLGENGAGKGSPGNKSAKLVTRL